MPNVKPDQPPVNKPGRASNLKASIAEFLLISKLRARSLLSRLPTSRLDAAADAAHSAVDAQALADDKAVVMARYTKILAVTCKQWFDSGSTHSTHQRRL